MDPFTRLECIEVHLEFLDSQKRTIELKRDLNNKYNKEDENSYGTQLSLYKIDEERVQLLKEQEDLLDQLDQDKLLHSYNGTSKLVKKKIIQFLNIKAAKAKAKGAVYKPVTDESFISELPKALGKAPAKALTKASPKAAVYKPGSDFIIHECSKAVAKHPNDTVYCIKAYPTSICNRLEHVIAYFSDKHKAKAKLVKVSRDQYNITWIYVIETRKWSDLSDFDKEHINEINNKEYPYRDHRWDNL